MTMAPMDFLAGTTCSLVPGTIDWGPGWYLVADNTRVEAGPFASQHAADQAAAYLDDHALGVHPAPYLPRYSSAGLLVGSRVRDRGRETSDQGLATAV